jgi:hypothetical protein
MFSTPFFVLLGYLDEKKISDKYARSTDAGESLFKEKKTRIWIDFVRKNF